jgi:phage terminase small subunit
MSSDNPKLTDVQKAFVLAWDGDLSTSAHKAGVPVREARLWLASDWFLREIEKRNDKELRLAVQTRIQGITDLIADRVSVQQMWTKVMLDPTQKAADRLKASELLAKSQGQFVEKIQVEEKPVGPQAKEVDLEERIALLSGEVKPVDDWLA